MTYVITLLYDFKFCHVSAATVLCLPKVYLLLVDNLKMNSYYH